MNCRHCGAELPKRPRARSIITGILFVAAAVVLLLFVHFPVIVLAAVLMAVVGAAFLRGRPRRCARCGR
jgi:Flp pilus assembly protein TadB